MRTRNGRTTLRTLGPGTVLGLVLTLAAGCGDDGATGPSARLADRIELSESRILCSSLGEIFAVEATVLDEEGNALAGGVTWTVSEPDVVEALGDGRFACRANGTTTLQARPGDPGAQAGSPPVATVEVTVEQRAVALGLGTEMFVAPSNRTLQLWSLGQSRELLAWSVDALGNPMDPVNDLLGWESEDDEVGSVHAGVVTAERHGRTAVHATADGFTGTIEVNVDARLTLRSCLGAPDPGGEGPCAEVTMTVAEEGR